MSAPIRVLVVDDDALICRALRRTLTAASFEVVTADSVSSARAEVQSAGPFGAVLCDLSLKDGSGAVLVDWLRETDPSLWSRTIVLTGGAMDPAGRRLVEGGEVEVLNKPFDLNWLVSRVTAVSARALTPS